MEPAAPAGYIRNCTFRYSQNYGIRIINSSPSLRNNLISDNLDFGIHISGNAQPSLGENSYADYCRNVFSNNKYGDFQIRNATNNLIHAYGNFWDWNSELLIDAHLYDNEENSGFGEILFSPWLQDLPRTPQITEFYHTTEGIWISWTAVTQSELGNPVSIAQYRVEMSPDPYAANPQWISLGSLPGTAGWITGEAFTARNMFFRIIAEASAE